MNINDYIWTMAISLLEPLDPTGPQQTGTLVYLNRITQERFILAPFTIDHLLKELKLTHSVVFIPPDIGGFFINTPKPPNPLADYNLHISFNTFEFDTHTNILPPPTTPEFIIELI
jgi:hypothetical protein